MFFSMNQPNFATKKVQLSDSYGVFELSPLPYGYGQSLGNALRRVILSAIPGYAATYVKINDLSHPFSTISGVKESALDMILSIKSLRFIAKGTGPFTLNLTVKGKGKVTAADFKSGEVEIVNKDQYIAEITTASAKLDITIIVEEGHGYSPSEDKEAKEIGMMSMDSIFSPVTKVNFKVQGTRVGRVSNFDKLIMEVWTDGSLSPEVALQMASEELAAYFSFILSGKETSDHQTLDTKINAAKIDEKVYETIIDELDLPTRVVNALLREGIETVGDLVQQGKEPLVDLKGVGRKSIDLIEVELNKLGVSFND
ncbi:MAG: DNA-directed RNA polymerase subunit alpha [Candidatus Roizmanbacteria bacterium]